MQLWIFLLFGVLVSGLRHSHSLEHDERKNLHKRQSDLISHYTGPVVPSYNFSMPIDHFNQSDERRYNNRYWINDTYYEPGGPVFFFDGGESGMSNASVGLWLAEVNGSTSIMALAKKYNGLAILWELRYFGDSLPFPLNDTTSNPAALFGVEPAGSPQTFEYNTVDQGLADVAYFAANISQGGYQRDNMTALLPSNTPWIWVGGSYPGTRGVLMRVQYPETIYATWASSAPTQANYDGSTYFNSALRSLPSNCSTDLKAVVQYVDEVFSGEHGQDDLTYLQDLAWVATSVSDNVSVEYNISEAIRLTPYTISTMMTSPYTTYYQSYGFNWTTRIFCDAFQSYSPNTPGNVTNDEYISILTNPGNATPSSQGFLAQNNNNLTQAIEAFWYAYRVYTQYTFDVLLPRQDRNQVPPNFRADQSAWLYTVVTQFGWFQGSNPDNITIVPSYKNFTAAQQMAFEVSFSNETIAALPDQPDVQSINKYGGWHVNPANTMFTDGEFDPWRMATVFSLDTNIGAPAYQPTTDIPACGEQPSDNNTRFGLIYPAEVHVPDLYEDPEFYGGRESTSYLSGLGLFQQALDVWLPCFGTNSSNGASIDQTGGFNATSTSTGAAPASTNVAARTGSPIMKSATLLLAVTTVWLVLS